MTLTVQQLTDIQARQVTYLQSHDHPAAFACCSAHATANDVPALLAEIDRLQAEADETSPRAFCQCCVFGNHTEPCTCASATCCHPGRHEAARRSTPKEG